MLKYPSIAGGFAAARQQSSIIVGADFAHGAKNNGTSTRASVFLSLSRGRRDVYELLQGAPGKTPTTNSR